MLLFLTSQISLCKLTINHLPQFANSFQNNKIMHHTYYFLITYMNNRKQHVIFRD